MNPSKTVYVPMTRMNLVGLLDSGLLAPARFLQRRKYYEDFTSNWPDFLLGFYRPCFPSPDAWIDDPDNLDFGVLVEVSLPTDTSEHHGVIDDGTLKSTMRRARTSRKREPVLLFTQAVPARLIERILTPGPRTRQCLVEDPNLIDRSSVPKIDVLEAEPRFITLGDEAALRGVDIDTGEIILLEQELKFAGAACALGETCRRQLWTTGHGFSTHVMSMIFSLAALRDSGSVEIQDFTGEDGYCKLRQPDIFSPAGLGTLARLAVPEPQAARLIGVLGSLEEELRADGEIHEDVLRAADLSAMLLLINEVTQANPLESTPKDIVRVWAARLQAESASFGGLIGEILSKRLHVAAARILECASGLEPVEQFFDRRVDWAKSIRAALLFVLRPEPKAMMNWPGAERPTRRASVDDLLRASFLTGLYWGYTRLPTSIKDRWMGSMNLIVFDQGKLASKDVRSEGSWRMEENGRIVGTLTASVGDCACVEVETGSTIRQLLSEFAEQVGARKQKGSLSKLDRRAIALLSGQVDFGAHRMLELSLTQALVAPGAGSRGRDSWDALSPRLVLDDEVLLDELANAPAESLTPEILVVLCHTLGYQAPPIENPSGRDTHYWLKLGMDRIVSSIVEAESGEWRDEEINSINRRGLELASEIVDLAFRTEIPESVRNRLLESMIYLFLPHDLVKDSWCPGPELVDDWIVLSDAIGMAADQVEAESTPFATQLVTISDSFTALVSDIEKQFGAAFVRAVRAGRSRQASPSH